MSRSFLTKVVLLIIASCVVFSLVGFENMRAIAYAQTQEPAAGDCSDALLESLKLLRQELAAIAAERKEFEEEKVRLANEYAALKSNNESKQNRIDVLEKGLRCLGRIPDDVVGCLLNPGKTCSDCF